MIYATSQESPPKDQLYLESVHFLVVVLQEPNIVTASTELFSKACSFSRVCIIMAIYPQQVMPSSTLMLWLLSLMMKRQITRTYPNLLMLSCIYNSCIHSINEKNGAFLVCQYAFSPVHGPDRLRTRTWLFWMEPMVRFRPGFSEIHWRTGPNLTLPSLRPSPTMNNKKLKIIYITTHR